MAVDKSPKGPGEGAPPERNRSRDVRLVVLGIVAVLVVWFCIQNHRTVRVDFWLVSTNVSLLAVILLSGVLGAAIALLIGRRRRAPKADQRPPTST